MNLFEMNALFLCVLWVVSAAEDDCAGKGFILPTDMEHGICQPCTDCAEMSKFVGKPCGPYADTVCCPGPSMTVEGNECLERNTLSTTPHSSLETTEMTSSKNNHNNEIPVNAAQATGLTIFTFVLCNFLKYCFTYLID